MRRTLCVAALLLVVATGCSLHDPTPTNVRPPKPGVPAGISDLTGIYRTIHQGVLQLRSDGQFSLILPEGPGPTSGSFSLQDGHMSIVDKTCGTVTGQYDVTVTGVQQPGKAVLNFAAVDDPCDQRRHYLTVDPWIYANS